MRLQFFWKGNAAAILHFSWDGRGGVRGAHLVEGLGHEGYVGFAGGFLLGVLLQPGFPVLAGCAIFAGELDAGDVGVGGFTLVGGVRGEVTARRNRRVMSRFGD